MLLSSIGSVVRWLAVRQARSQFPGRHSIEVLPARWTSSELEFLKSLWGLGTEEE